MKDHKKIWILLIHVCMQLNCEFTDLSAKHQLFIYIINAEMYPNIPFHTANAYDNLCSLCLILCSQATFCGPSKVIDPYCEGKQSQDPLQQNIWPYVPL